MTKIGFLCEFVARARQPPHQGEALLSHSGALWPSLRGSGLLQPGSAPAVFPRCGAAIASACEQLPQAMSSAHAPKRARTEQGAAGPPAAERQAPGVAQIAKIPRSHLVKLAGGTRCTRFTGTSLLCALITLQLDKRE